MPRGDRTGPDGKGSKTGRGLGDCADSDSPGFTKGSRRGMGRIKSNKPRRRNR